MLNRQRQRGMSIIEVMIAVTLAALLLALGMPSFFTGIQNRQIRTAAEAIQTGLQTARTEALRRNRNVAFLLGTQTAWTVGCDPVDPTVDVPTGEVFCPGLLQTGDGSSSPKASVQPLQMTAGTTTVAGTPVFTGKLIFNPLGRVTDPAKVPGGTLPAGSVAVFDITNPTGGTCAADGGEMRCLRVVVTAAGQVRMCDPAVTVATDPRRCNELLP